MFGRDLQLRNTLLHTKSLVFMRVVAQHLVVNARAGVRIAIGAGIRIIWRVCRAVRFALGTGVAIIATVTGLG